MGRFTNTEYGFRLATSVKGTGTGERVHFVVADDPLKIQLAHSEPERFAVNHSWDQVISGRGVSPEEVVFVIIMQRLHEKDLSGHLLAKDQGYEHLMLPMEFDPSRKCSTSIGFEDPREEDGELLWPDRWNKPYVEDWKVTLGPQGAAGQLDQSPRILREGGIFSDTYFKSFGFELVEPKKSPELSKPLATPVEQELWFLLRDKSGQIIKRWRADDCNWFQTVDTAMKLKQVNDYTCVGTFAITPDLELLVVEIKRQRIPVPKQYDFVLRQREIWPYVLFQAIEDKQSGTGIIQEGVIEGTPFRTLVADVDKVRRASQISTMYRNGLVYHLEGRAWLSDFENELVGFPGKFDDQVDVVSYAGILYKTEQLLRTFSKIDPEKLAYPSDKDVEEMRREASEEKISVEVGGVVVDFEDDSGDNPFE